MKKLISLISLIMAACSTTTSYPVEKLSLKPINGNVFAARQLLSDYAQEKKLNVKSSEIKKLGRPVYQIMASSEGCVVFTGSNFMETDVFDVFIFSCPGYAPDTLIVEIQKKSLAKGLKVTANQN